MIDVTSDQKEMLRDLFKKHTPGIEVWVFGSRVVGSAKPSSDLDVALYATQSIPLQTVALLETALQEAPLPFKVDCVDVNSISDSFRRIIEGQRERLL
jgi:uncharacterized protein